MSVVFLWEAHKLKCGTYAPRGKGNELSERDFSKFTLEASLITTQGKMCVDHCSVMTVYVSILCMHKHTQTITRMFSKLNAFSVLTLKGL